MNKKLYYNSNGNNGVDGFEYQHKLITYLLLRAHYLNQTFVLATEMTDAEKFDDIVYTFENNNKDPKLLDYFTEYQFDVLNLLESSKKCRKLNKDKYNDMSDQLYNKYNNFLEKIKKKNNESDEKMSSNIFKKEIQDFFDKLIFAVNQPNENDLEIKIKTKSEFTLHLKEYGNLDDIFFKLKLIQLKENLNNDTIDELDKFFDKNPNRFLIISTQNLFLTKILIGKFLMDKNAKFIFKKLNELKNDFSVDNSLYSKFHKYYILESDKDLEELRNELNKYSDNKKIILITKKSNEPENISHDKTTINNFKFSNESEFKMNVTFQGKEIQFDFNDLLDPTEHKSKLIEFFNSETLEKLIFDKFELGFDFSCSNGYDNNLYISRTLFYKNKIKDEAIDKLENDLFLITGNRRFQKKDVLYQNIIYENFQPIEKFKELCKDNSNKNIHWLSYESEGFLWKKTHGNISKLYEYLDKSFEKTIKEDDLIDNDIFRDNIIIISDTSGMGKSTFLTNLMLTLKEKDPSFLVLRIELNNLEMNYTNEEAVNFLKKLIGLGNSIKKRIFDYFLKNEKIILMFDGFDELRDNSRKSFLNLIQSLKEKDFQFKKVLITTRPNRKELEISMVNFGFNFKPFTPDDQKNFLIKFWSLKIDVEENNERLIKFSDDTLKNFKNIIENNRKDFMGIPLQTRMIAECLYDDCKYFIDNNHNQIVPKFFLNMGDLYTYFIKEKYQIILKEKKLLITEDEFLG
ncbi:unnamed protein product, partial [Brachionus calyciflorus]